MIGPERATHAVQQNQEPRRGERGATVIEYGIIVSILLISLSTVITRFQESEASIVVASQNRVGTPPEVLSYNAGAAGNPIAPGGGGGGGGGSTIQTTVSTAGTATAQGSKKWTAIVEMVALDGSGNPVLDAQIAGTWTLTGDDGSLTTSSANCSSDSSGVCNISKWGLQRIPPGTTIVSAEFVIDGVTGQDLVPAAGVIGSTVTIAAP